MFPNWKWLPVHLPLEDIATILFDLSSDWHYIKATVPRPSNYVLVISSISFPASFVCHWLRPTKHAPNDGWTFAWRMKY